MDEPRDLATLKGLLADIPDTAERLGLLFQACLAGPAYDQTPRNCVTFASTGGDGVHFSFLLVGDDFPVVMTVPMADEPNRVVGRNLRHFLGLGRKSGFFMLEQLQYAYADTVAALDRYDLDKPDEAAAQVLDLMAERLDAEGWCDHGAVLQELAAEFADRLDIVSGE